MYKTFYGINIEETSALTGQKDVVALFEVANSIIIAVKPILKFQEFE